MKSIPLEDILTAVAHSPNVVSRKPIWEKYDKNVQGNTFIERGQAAVSVIMPFTDFPELPADKKSVGVAVGTGGNPNVAMLNAYHAAASGIAEAALKIACVGGDWLGATDCLNFGNPEKEDQMGLFVEGVNGVKEACSALNIPIVSGNVSLYNESNDQSIPPSALVSVFGRVDNPSVVKPSFWNETGLHIYRLGHTTALGGSEFNRLFDLQSTQLPELDFSLVQAMADQLRGLVLDEAVQSIIPIGPGGVWGSLVGAAMKAQQGFKLDLNVETAVADLLAEPLGALVLSRKPIDGLAKIGETQSSFEAALKIDSENKIVDLSTLEQEWRHQLRQVV